MGKAKAGLCYNEVTFSPVHTMICLKAIAHRFVCNIAEVTEIKREGKGIIYTSLVW